MHEFDDTWTLGDRIRWFFIGVGGLRDWPYFLRRGIRNVARYAPVVWHDADCDHAPLFLLMEFKLRQMAKRQIGHIGWERSARRMLVCAALCKRIAADEYGLEPMYFKAYRYSKLARRARQRDLEYVCHLIGKHALGWWD